MSKPRDPQFPDIMARLKPANSNVPESPEMIWQYIAKIAQTKGLVLDAPRLKPIIIDYFSKHNDEATEIAVISSNSSMVEQTERAILVAGAINHALADYVEKHADKLKDAAPQEALAINQLAIKGQLAINAWNSYLPFSRDWCEAQGDPFLTCWLKAPPDAQDARKQAISEALALLSDEDGALKKDVWSKLPSAKRDKEIYGKMLAPMSEVTGEFSRAIHAKDITSDEAMLLVVSDLLWQAAQQQVTTRMISLNNEIQQKTC